jgi:predicted nuclease with TOPRIM domain
MSDLMKEVVRVRKTEAMFRGLDTGDIVEIVHRLEDCISTLEDNVNELQEHIAQLEAENAALREQIKKEQGDE